MGVIRATLCREQGMVAPGIPAGSYPYPLVSAEAVSAMGLAQVLRTGAGSHDQEVPVRSFQDDLVRKLRLKSVMPKKKEQDGDGEEKQYTKEETNYRYSGDEMKMCGVCRYFVEPGACEIVSGLIRPVDVCDLFEPARGQEAEQDDDNDDDDYGLDAPYQRAIIVTPTHGLNSKPVHAELIPPATPMPDGGDMDWGDVYMSERRRTTMPTFPVVQAELAEVTPPGGERVVKALKKRKGVRSPWAVAWAMKKKGYISEGPAVKYCPKHQRFEPVGAHKTEVDLSEYEALGEVTPPGWERTVKKMKRRPEITNPWALAWWMKGKGYKPGGKSSEARHRLVQASMA